MATEKEILDLAAAIVKSQLAATGEVRIAGFGRWYTSQLKTAKSFGSDEKVVRTVVRFKPFEGLKRAINGEAEAAPTETDTVSLPPAPVTPSAPVAELPKVAPVQEPKPTPEPTPVVSEAPPEPKPEPKAAPGGLFGDDDSPLFGG